MDVLAPKTPEDIYKTHLLEGGMAIRCVCFVLSMFHSLLIRYDRTYYYRFHLANEFSYQMDYNKRVQRLR